jgi:hypothetical protein
MLGGKGEGHRLLGLRLRTSKFPLIRRFSLLAQDERAHLDQSRSYSTARVEGHLIHRPNIGCDLQLP